MPGHQILSVFLLSAMFIGLSACKDPQINPKKLEGYWALTKATRESELTNTLEGTWINFDTKTSTFESNIPLGLNGQMPYTFAKDQVSVQSNPPLELQIVALSGTSLQAGFNARGFSFELFIRKTDRPSEELPVGVPVEQ